MPAAPARLLLYLIFFTVLAWAAMLVLRRPSNDREWAPDHARLAEIELNDTTVRIRGMRSFRWHDPERFDTGYREATYDLRRVESTWLVLAPFSKAWRGPAHTFVSFGFDDSTYLAISVEARRERGEEYGLLRGLSRSYELIYLIGDEEDLIGKRALGEFDLYLFPIRTTPERARAALRSMLERAERLRLHPEFYNTVSNNCTSNLVAHVNRVAPGRIPLGIKLLAPGYADEVAAGLGLIDSTGSLQESRRRYRINDRARTALGRPDFSRLIRR